MEVTINKKTASHAFIKVTINEADYQPEVNKKIKDYARTAAIKGFRPGKAPIGLIKKMVGKDLKVEEVSKAVSKGLFDYIREEDLNLIGQPMGTTVLNEREWMTNKDFDFEFEVGLVPEFEVDLSKEVSLVEYKIEAAEKQIDETIERLRTSNPETSNPEESAAGDFLKGKITSTSEKELEVETLIPLNQIVETEQEQFFGLKKDAKLSFDLSKVFDEPKKCAMALGIEEEDAAELTTCDFELEEITRKSDAELNEDFFRKVLGPEADDKETVTEEDFRAKVKDILEENLARESKAMLTVETQNYFIENTTIDISEEFLSKWFEYLSEENAQFSEEKEQQSYLKSLRWRLIMENVALKNKVEVEEADIRQGAKEEARNFFGMMGMQNPDDAQLEQFADIFLADKEQGKKKREEYYHKALQDKVFNIIHENITLESQNVSDEEFAEISKKWMEENNPEEIQEEEAVEASSEEAES